MNDTVHASPIDPQDAPATLGADAGVQFLLGGASRTLDVQGCRAELPAGGTATLAERVQAFFAAAPAGLPLLVGALPFAPAADDRLFQPLHVSALRRPAPIAAPSFNGAIRAEPDAQAYAQTVRAALQMLEDDAAPLRKVVLARSLCVDAPAALDPRALALRLGQDPGVAPFVVPLPTAAGDAPAWLVGASPELLVSKRGVKVSSHPLAGSARRSDDPVADAAAAQALLASAKDHDEHRYVVEAIVEALAPWCVSVQAPSRPQLQATASMWHLGTRIEARLRDPATPVAALLAALHPTPAVCGTPRAPALEVIAALEPQPRGFYAGAVGWMDAAGDGEWYVAIRCARVQGAQARLYAGAGIVAGSQPALEVAETAAKFTALLHALGVPAALQEPSNR